MRVSLYQAAWHTMSKFIKMHEAAEVCTYISARKLVTCRLFFASWGHRFRPQILRFAAIALGAMVLEIIQTCHPMYREEAPHQQLEHRNQNHQSHQSHHNMQPPMLQRIEFELKGIPMQRSLFARRTPHNLFHWSHHSFAVSLLTSSSYLPDDKTDKTPKIKQQRPSQRLHRPSLASVKLSSIFLDTESPTSLHTGFRSKSSAASSKSLSDQLEISASCTSFAAFSKAPFNSCESISPGRAGMWVEGAGCTAVLQ